MATIPRRSVIHVAPEEAAIAPPQRVTIAPAALAETAREGLLALSVGLGLAVVGEILEEELTSWSVLAASMIRNGRPTGTARRIAS